MRRGVGIRQHCGNLFPFAICPLRDRSVRLCTKLALVGLRDERGHQLAITDRPGGRSAHRLVGHFRHRPAVEVSSVLDQLDDVEHRLARDRSNEREKRLRTETVAAIEDCEAACSLLPVVAASRAASAVSYCRVACPIAAHTTISKIWSSLRPDPLAAAISSSVTLQACLATLSTSTPTGLVSPLLLNAAARSEGEALPSPSRIRLTSDFRLCPISDIKSLLPTLHAVAVIGISH